MEISTNADWFALGVLISTLIYSGVMVLAYSWEGRNGR